ncbi:branched-chain amino acid transporter AzlD [Acetobacterium paludosum]|uniref:Branched-chain amino acid transporter AzlD n=2 Tax=Acetobacterium paludosum TaxID=52693 RepID=A0A923HSD3_9FIRM|nr:AzlD domain-containing protein [Acetobacterium paludosum]MBC3886922.1 branched-chain amino acid transporter AzlD [Acetobacterium paludosum]
MTVDFTYSVAALMIVALVTALTRATPYLLFGGKREMPKTVSYLGNVLPASIMIILVLYCLRNINLTAFPFGLAEFFSVAVVITVQIIKNNTFLSIILGTACYMILIRTVFLV